MKSDCDLHRMDVMICGVYEVYCGSDYDGVRLKLVEYVISIKV